MWTYFLLKEEGKERIKVSSIFVKDMTGNLVEHTFSCLTDILFRTSHWTISNSLLNTKLIEAEVNVPKSVLKETKKLNLIDGSNHAWKSVNNRFDLYRIFKHCK